LSILFYLFEGKKKKKKRRKLTSVLKNNKLIAPELDPKKFDHSKRKNFVKFDSKGEKKKKKKNYFFLLEYQL